MKHVHLPRQHLHLGCFCETVLVQGEESHYCSSQSRARAAARGGLVSLGELHGLYARRKDVDTDGSGRLVASGTS